MSASLRIERLALRYRISTRHPAPALVRTDLDRELSDRLPAFCAAAVAGTVPGNEGVVVIQRLDVKLGLLDRAGVGRQLSSLCARAITRGLARALAGELGPSRVARYPSRADYWACFVSDLARGTAAQRWQYASFGGLRAAPPAAALRAAQEAGASLSQVLAALADRGRLSEVAAAVPEIDATALLDLLEPGPAGPSPPAAAEVLAVLDRPEAARLGPAALSLFLVGTLTAGRPGRCLAKFSLRVLRQAAAIAVWQRSLPAGRPAHAWRSWPLGSPPAKALVELERTVPELAAHLRHEPTAPRSAPRVKPVDVTSFGGLFLLLPVLAELDAAGRLTAEGRCLVLAKCLPVEARARAWYDPALWLAAGTDCPPTLADLRMLGAPPLRKTWAAWAEATLRGFARRLPHFQRSSGDYLARNFLFGASSYRVEEDRVSASLPQVSLRLVLQMSGWAGSVHLIHWLPGGRLQLGSD